MGRSASPKNWEHSFPSFEAFKIAWRELGSKQILVPNDYIGKVGVCWDLDEFLKYISTQDNILDTMRFPLLDGECRYVLIIRGDGFPSGSRPWVQLAIVFGNHGQKARTLAYNSTIDVDLTSEHDIDALREIFSKTLEAIQSINNTRWILIREKLCRAAVMLGGDSLWLRKVLGISTYFRIGSIYIYAVWCDLQGKLVD